MNKVLETQMTLSNSDLKEEKSKWEVEGGRVGSGLEESTLVQEQEEEEQEEQEEQEEE